MSTKIIIFTTYRLDTSMELSSGELKSLESPNAAFAPELHLKESQRQRSI